MKLGFLLPIRTGRGLNDRLNPFARHRQNKSERRAVALLFPRLERARMVPPFVVTLTRVSPATRPMDCDNLTGALKSIRDEVARQLKIDDGDRSKAVWQYRQERGKWAVVVSIEGGD